MDDDHDHEALVVVPVPEPPKPKYLIPIKEDGSKKKRSTKGGPNKDEPWVLPLAILAGVLVALLIGMWLFRPGFGGTFWGPQGRYAGCPRPPEPAQDQPQFNEQQRDIRYLRRRAFQGDFFAQLQLGKRYEGATTSDRNLQDPVESAVWYAMSLTNPDGYSSVGPKVHVSPFGRRVSWMFDDCRKGERDNAYRTLNRLLSQMSTDERDKVRDRVTYVLSTQGPAGLRTLSRVHDAGFGPFGEPPDDEQALFAEGRPGQRGWSDATGLFERNGVDAYMYDYLAMQTGDMGAYVLLQDPHLSWQGPSFADLAESRARRWVPPYEFYPPDAPDSGVPHSDESEPNGEIDRIALYRIRELPFKHIAEALVYLHVMAKPCSSERDLGEHDIDTFQAMLGRPATGHLSPLDKVRIIQFAAINGSPHAQLVLAVMYAQGVGVSPDYARAYHWFQEADRQGSPEAKFAISTYFSEGLQGVADQDKAQAVVKQLDSALSGFRPSVNRLRALLERVSPGRRRGWPGYVRPEEVPYYSGVGGDRYGYGGPDTGPGPDGGPPPDVAAGPGPDENWTEAAGDTRPNGGPHYGPRYGPDHRPSDTRRDSSGDPPASSAAPNNGRGAR